MLWIKCIIIEDMGYDNLVISIKSSDVMMCVKAHELIAANQSSSACGNYRGRNTVIREISNHPSDLGLILNQGIGDTIRVSLTGDPLEEIKSAKLILKRWDFAKVALR